MYLTSKLVLPLVALVILLLALGGCPAPSGNPTQTDSPGASGSAEGMKWWPKLEQAQQEAKDFKQPIVVDFGAEWCGWCKKLEQESFPAPEVQALKDKFVWARVDIDASPELAKKYDISGVPVIMVIDAEGKPLARQVGFVEGKELASFLTGALAKASG